MCQIEVLRSITETDIRSCTVITSCAGRTPQYAPAPCKLAFDLLTLKVVSESPVTWATSVPILVFPGLSVLDLGPMYATDKRQTDIHQTPSSLNAPAIGDGGITTKTIAVQHI